MGKQLRKIISLNTWGGSGGTSIYKDILHLAETADVLCLQEVHRAPAHYPRTVMPSDPGKRQLPLHTQFGNIVESMLSDCFVAHFAPQLVGCYHDCERAPEELSELQYGNMVLVRREFSHTHESTFINGELGQLFDAESMTPAGKTAQRIDITDGINVVSIVSGHGAWFRGDKGDQPWRLAQTEKLLRLASHDYDHVDTLALESDYLPRVVLLGDLNVLASTKVIQLIKKSKVFGRVGADYLNGRYGIWDTRTDLYTGVHREADHAFASPCLNAALAIDKSVASDHAALLVTIDT